MSDDDYQYSDQSEDDEAEQIHHRAHSAIKHEETLSGSSYNQSVLQDYSIITKHNLLNQQARRVSTLCELLRINSEESWRILVMFRWDENAILAEFVKNSDDGITELRRSCGLVSKEPPFSSENCMICFDTLEQDKSLANDFCGHKFCSDCWEQHALVQIQEGNFRNLRCMLHGCKCFVSQRLMGIILAKQPEALEKYKRSVLESFIEDNPNVKWCPSVPCCGNAIDVSISPSHKLDCECSCEELFCFNCYAPSHCPAPCEWAREWWTKLEKDAPTAVFIALNCKPCPRCHKQITKSMGCNLMACVCGAYFCWLCGGETGFAHNWHHIEGHTCKVHREPPKGASDEAVAKRKFDTYLFYLTRFSNNQKSEGFEKELLTKLGLQPTDDPTTDKQKQLVNSTADNDWIIMGLKQLVRMRSFLAWSFVVSYNAFYEANGERIRTSEAKLKGVSIHHYQTLYESLQTQMQTSVESLSSLLGGQSIDETKKATVLQLIHATHSQAISVWRFAVEEIFNKGMINCSEPNVYFPLRKLAMGLGIRTVSLVAASSKSAEQVDNKLPIVHTTKPEGEVIDLTQSTSKNKKKRQKRGVRRFETLFG